LFAGNVAAENARASTLLSQINGDISGACDQLRR